MYNYTFGSKKTLIIIFSCLLIFLLLGCGNDESVNQKIKTEYKEPAYACTIDMNTRSGFPLDPILIEKVLKDDGKKQFKKYKRFKPTVFLNNNTNYPEVYSKREYSDKYGDVYAKGFVSIPTIKLEDEFQKNGIKHYGVSCDIILVSETASRKEKVVQSVNYTMLIQRTIEGKILVYEALGEFRNFSPEDTTFYKKADDVMMKMGEICVDVLES